MGFPSGKHLERKLFPGLPTLDGIMNPRFAITAEQLEISSDWAPGGPGPMVESEGGHDNT